MNPTQVTHLQKTIDWLLTQRFTSGNLRSSLGSKDDKLIHWCHGAPGAIYMFLEAHAVSFQIFTICVTIICES